jgi:hypothetical protein
MRTCGAVEVQLHAFLTLALGGGERLVSRADHCTPIVWEVYLVSEPV